MQAHHLEAEGEHMQAHDEKQMEADDADDEKHHQKHSIFSKPHEDESFRAA